jgi:hypothetical protein
MFASEVRELGRDGSAQSVRSPRPSSSDRVGPSTDAGDRGDAPPGPGGRQDAAARRAATDPADGGMGVGEGRLPVAGGGPTLADGEAAEAWEHPWVG